MTIKAKTQTHAEYLAGLSPAEREAHDADVEEVREEIENYKRTLAGVRKARELTQVTMAEMLGTSQGEVSRIEHAGDLYLSTLARYVQAMGGELELVARFGDDEAVTLTVGDVADNGILG